MTKSAGADQDREGLSAFWIAQDVCRRGDRCPPWTERQVQEVSGVAERMRLPHAQAATKWF